MIYITGGLVVFFILVLIYFLFRLWLESRRERTTPSEIFHGREGAKCLLQGDWKYWGQLALDVERTALSQAGNALYFVMRGQVSLDIWRFRVPIKIR